MGLNPGLLWSYTQDPVRGVQLAICQQSDTTEQQNMVVKALDQENSLPFSFWQDSLRRHHLLWSNLLSYFLRVKLEYGEAGDSSHVHVLHSAAVWIYQKKELKRSSNIFDSVFLGFTISEGTITKRDLLRRRESGQKCTTECLMVSSNGSLQN